MRRIVTALVAPALVLACLAAVVRGGEPPTAEQAAAAEIGRGLLSPVVAERRAAEARLLERLRRGGDLEAFVRAMSDGVAEWANRNERLMEVWLRQAVDGTAEERDQAVRLLAALGPAAVRRLSQELRHQLRHGRSNQEAATGGEPTPAPLPQPEAKADSHEVRQQPGVPRIYDLADLAAHGMNAVQLRSLLQKAADAHQVRQYGTHYVVTATEKGHAALLGRLQELRGAQAEQEDESPPQEGSTPNDAGTEAEEPAPPESAAPPPPDVGAKATGEADAGGELPAFWRVEPVFVHLPEAASVDGVWVAGDALQPTAVSLGRPRVRVGSFSELEEWSRKARRVPDARPESPVLDDPTVRLGRTLHLFLGKELRYSKDVRATKGGAWSLVTGSVRHGIGVDVALQAARRGLHVDVAATRTEVGLPIPVHTIKPAPDAAPVELERPEWSTTRARASFVLPPGGGGAFVVLDGLGAPQDEKVVLLLTLRPQPDRSLNPRMQKAPK